MIYFVLIFHEQNCILHPSTTYLPALPKYPALYICTNSRWQYPENTVISQSRDDKTPIRKGAKLTVEIAVLPKTEEDTTGEPTTDEGLGDLMP